ncbi:hypothetical protein [Streptococcus suis]|uniref:hypothetical protein n=1 Tax=Streptococcus suis TaxID=1307 RepID=UPI0028B22DC8|nr:hypothetical protein [Streptococcus suis]WNN03751.1 hypothetical protein RMQ63_01135 [Streptococcus suis]WNN11245.1 hypothetical protein RMQ62_00195 [Streptococcus suis]WNO79772.1 hypothetical protein RMP65_05750 [Streptococcus suis]
MSEIIRTQLSRSKSVEDLLKKETEKLNWQYVDVLFSFKGIYSLGIKAFYPNMVGTVENGTILYPFINKKLNSKQRLYSGTYLLEHFEEYKELNNLKELRDFIHIYETLGNLIPVWPGANSHRGVFGVYDLADLYFYDSKIEKLGRLYYKNFHSKYSVYSIGRFCFEKSNTPYKLQDFLSMNREEYIRFLKHIVEVIENRNSELVSNQH